MTDAADWGELKAEAQIIVDLLRSLPPDSPRMTGVIERALELQRLGVEAAELVRLTQGTTRN